MPAAERAVGRAAERVGAGRAGAERAGAERAGTGAVRAGAGRTGDRGSALALVPAGFLILLLLGALAVDDGAAYLGQRDLSANLQAAANDAAGSALSSASFYGRGAVQIDAGQAAKVVCGDLAAQGSDGLFDRAVSMAVTGDTVYVEAHALVRAVFGRSIPGFADRPVSAVAAAVAATGPGTRPAPAPGPGSFTPLDC